MEALAVIVPIARPWAVILLVVMGVGVGWKWPKFVECGSKRSGKLAAVVEPDEFGFDADDMMCLMIVNRVSMAQLL